jgi:hypothetical protein
LQALKVVIIFWFLTTSPQTVGPFELHPASTNTEKDGAEIDGILVIKGRETRPLFEGFASLNSWTNDMASSAKRTGSSLSPLKTTLFLAAQNF